MGQIVRTREDAQRRCADSGTWVHPVHRSARKPGTAWCGCCGRMVRTEELPAASGGTTVYYAEHKLGSGGTIRRAS